jgi:hypothetical protein
MCRISYINGMCAVYLTHLQYLKLTLFSAVCLHVALHFGYARVEVEVGVNTDDCVTSKPSLQTFSHLHFYREMYMGI